MKKLNQALVVVHRNIHNEEDPTRQVEINVINELNEIVLLIEKQLNKKYN